MVAGFGAVRSITIPASVWYVGRHAFELLYALEAIKGGEGITDIDRYTFPSHSPFYQSYFGKNLILGQGVLVKAVYDNLPADGSVPTTGTVTVPAGVKVIAYSALGRVNDVNLQGMVTEINLPQGLARIKSHALENFEGSSITFPDGVVVETTAFGYTSLRTLKDIWVGKNVTFEVVRGGEWLSTINEPFTGTLHLPDGEVWGSTDGLFPPGSKYTVDCQRGTLDEAQMPEGVTIAYRD